MRKIIEIVGVEERINKQTKKPYFITLAVVDDGTEVSGYGKDFKVDDLVEVFFHKHVIKMQKTKPST